MLVFKDDKLTKWSVVSAGVLIQKSLHSMLYIELLALLLSYTKWIKCVDN